ncbi:hypothetical protein D3C78_1172020 [compost metagenome]
MIPRKDIESPSIERQKLIEKRMEMIALLINKQGEGGINRLRINEETQDKARTSSKSASCYVDKIISSWNNLKYFKNMLLRMFL